MKHCLHWTRRDSWDQQGWVTRWGNCCWCNKNFKQHEKTIKDPKHGPHVSQTLIIWPEVEGECRHE